MANLMAYFDAESVRGQREPETRSFDALRNLIRNPSPDALLREIGMILQA